MEGAAAATSSVVQPGTVPSAFDSAAAAAAAAAGHAAAGHASAATGGAVGSPQTATISTWPPQARPGCLGRPTPAPPGGWYPVEGGGRAPDDLHDATEVALAPDANAALRRLSAEAGAALPAGFTAASASELRTRSCVLKRVLTFTAPWRGRVVFAWE